MKIEFIGTGGAFDWEVGNSAAIITFRGKRILIDCGHSVFPKLMQLGIADSIDYLLLTHLHDDHCGSATSFIFAQYFLVTRRPYPVLAATPEFKVELNDYFRHSFVEVEQYAQLLMAEQEIHGLTVIDTTNLHFPGMRTYAFLFEENGDYILYSGDIGVADYLFNYLASKSIQRATVFHDLSFFDVPAHAYYKRVIPHIGQHTVFGYHNNPSLNPPDNPIPLVHHQPEFRLY
jgi:ribonuclease BN (tRNA processing enzyme)